MQEMFHLKKAPNQQQQQQQHKNFLSDFYLSSASEDIFYSDFVASHVNFFSDLIPSSTLLSQ